MLWPVRAALQMFLEEKVDVAILEVGLGGRLDATNCIPAPPVAGISHLGMDHTELLGDTLQVGCLGLCMLCHWAATGIAESRSEYANLLAILSRPCTVSLACHGAVRSSLAGVCA